MGADNENDRESIAGLVDYVEWHGLVDSRHYYIRYCICKFANIGLDVDVR